MTAKTRWWALTAVSLATLMCYLDSNDLVFRVGLRCACRR